MTTDLDKAMERARRVVLRLRQTATVVRGYSTRTGEASEMEQDADAIEALSSANARAKAAEEVLRELVQINEQHNAAVEKVIGRPVGWRDSYLDRARALLAKLEVRG